jgi:hypothetical protein
VALVVGCVHAKPFQRPSMKCPGQDRRYWIGEPTFDVPCPKCGTMVELFRDEGSGRCRNCGHRFPNPKAAFGCAQWCPQAKECMGLAPLARVPESKIDGTVAARLIQAVERALAGDPPRLAHSLVVFQHAKQLLEREGGDPRVILAAALLLQCVPDHATNGESSADGPPCLLADSSSTRQILQHVGFDRDTIRGICQLMWAYRTSEERNTLELNIVSDSDRLAQLTEQDRAIAPEDLENIIQRDLHTAAGKVRARELFTQRSC